MKEISNKKVFLSSDADRGILVKFSKGKNKVLLSFWGNDDPKNVSFSKKEALDFCSYIMENTADEPLSESNIWDDAVKNMHKHLPETHFKK